MKAQWLLLGSALGSFLLGSACSGGDEADLGNTESLSSVTPSYLAGNPTCADLGYVHHLKIDDPPTGTHTYPLLAGGSVTYTFSADGKTMSWSSTLGLDAVLMKAGDGAYVYTYSPEATSDGNVITPNNSGGQQAQISHVDFCYDLEVQVAKTAATSFTRDTDWSIQKTAAASSLVLSLNQAYNLGFTVTVSATSSTESDFAVGGAIRVSNPDPDYTATLGSVTDTMSGFGSVAVDCGAVTFPLTLARAGSAGDSITCQYATGVPDKTARTNTGTATMAAGSAVGGGSDTVAVVFSDASSTIHQIDGCVTVTDLHQGTLGQVCATDGSKSWQYTVPVPSDTCGPSTLTNTATYTGSSETNSSTAVVGVSIPCEAGCTLTQGYWKSHSSYGPAPYDADGWAGHENDTFFLSGQTAYQVLWTPPAGNAYYILADQYIAADRNRANGASFTAVQTAFAQATLLLQTYTPAQVKAMKSTSTVKQQFVTLAFLLDQYNNGITGPGHCSE